MGYRYQQNREQLLGRLRRIEGQVRGIARMVEQDAYCVDIVTQIQAAVSALEKVGLHLLAEHIRGCVRDALVGGDAGESEEKITELIAVLDRLLKTRASRDGIAGLEGAATR